MPQLFLRPSADVSDGNWTDAAGGTTLFSSIDESSLDDADYIKSGLNPSADACKLELTNLSGDWEEPVILRFRIRKDNAATVANLTARLLQNNATLTTLNPSDKTANITLSNGNLTATLTLDSTNSGIRSVLSKSSGKWYWELTLDSVAAQGQIEPGIATAAWDLDAGTIGDGTDSLRWASDSVVKLNSSTIGIVDGYLNGDTLCWAVDYDAELLWCRVNGGDWNADAGADPATGTGGIDISGLAAGPYFVAVECFASAAFVYSLNFGATAYNQTKPSGFSNLGSGELEIAEWVYTDIAATFVTEEETLTTPQFESITDPDDLRVEFEASLAVPAYVGPGDVVSGAVGWWGLRAYSAATIGTNCIRLRESGGNTEQDFVTIAGGGLDLAAIATFKGANNLFVHTVYDQSGAGRNMVQTTQSNQLDFTLNDLNGLPTMGGVDGFFTSSSVITVAQPTTVSAVAQFDGQAGRWAYFGNVPGDVSIGSRGTDAIMNAGGEAGTAISSAWHRVQTILLDNAGNICIDGVSSSTLDPHSIGISADNICMFADTGSAASWDGKKMNEMGLWDIAFNGTQLTNMDANQETYWGL